MEDMLSGKSDHRTFAPLSAGQTLELVRHLKDDLRQVCAALEGLRKDAGETAEAVAVLQKEEKKQGSLLTALQGNLATTDKKLEEVKSGLGRTDGRLRDAANGLEAMNNKVDGLMEGEQRLKTRLDTMQGDADDMRKHIGVLKQDLEKNFEGDKSDRGEFEEVASRLFRALDKATKGLDDQRQATTSLDAKATKFSGELDQARVLLKNLEDRVDESSGNMKVISRDLDDTSTRNHKLLDDHERTKAKLAECHDTNRKLMSAQQDLEKGLHKANHDLQAAQQQLKNAQQALSTHHDKLTHAQDEVSRMGEGHRSTGNLLRGLQERLEETHNLACAVKDGLKETNSIVLPNIMMDAEHTGVLGSSMSSGFASELRPPATPRRPGTHSGRRDLFGETSRTRGAAMARNDRTLLPAEGGGF